MEGGFQEKSMFRLKSLSIVPIVVILAVPDCQLLPQSVPAFEAVSVKRSEGVGRPRVRGGPNTEDPLHVFYSGYSLMSLIMDAYGLASSEIAGPGWLESERYDLQASLSTAAGRDEFRLMLRGVLAERFQMVLHSEPKNAQIYNLRVAKGGPRLTPSAPDSPVATGEELHPKKGLGKDGFPDIPVAAGPPTILKMRGRVKFAARGKTMDELAALLSGELGRNVKNQTGITGTYDITLFYQSEGNRLRDREQDAPTAGEYNAPTLQDAVRSQLGLVLESARGSVNILVVDHIEKIPTAN